MRCTARYDADKGKTFMMRVPAPIIAALLLAGCATPGAIEVTRFHLGTPLPRAGVAVVPADPALAGSLEFAHYADAVAAEFARAGFERAMSPGGATYLAEVGITQASTALRRPSPFSIGFGIGVGGGGYGGGSAVGAGVSGPVGRGRIETRRTTALRIRLKRRVDDAVVWEGTATDAVSSAPTDVAVPTLAHAALMDFPGRSGMTARYPLPRP